MIQYRNSLTLDYGKIFRNLKFIHKVLESIETKKQFDSSRQWIKTQANHIFTIMDDLSIKHKARFNLEWSRFEELWKKKKEQFNITIRSTKDIMDNKRRIYK